MVVTFSSGWASAEPFAMGLKFGGLMNQALEQDDTFRKGRHHFMTALNQILEWNLALEQVARYFQMANISYSLKSWSIARYIVPMGVAYLASRQIQELHISKIANFVQDHLGTLCLIVMAVSTVALYRIGQMALAVTTLSYLSLGVLSRYNILPQSVQNLLHRANFFIGNLTGLYLGGNFVRLICSMNLMIAAVEKYFEHRQSMEEKEVGNALDLKEQEIPEENGLEDKAEKTTLSLTELQQLTNDTECPIRRAHVHKKSLPPVDADVRIEEILERCDQIDWSKHEHVVEKKLSKDKRWVEVGQFQSKPLDYFKRNLQHLIESIKNRDILEGKPASYEMLEYYCRYIAQNLKEQDEMTQADLLILLGVEGGEYCGAGKFGIIEEVYENLLSQANGLPLETRVLACEQQERKRVWQHIYQLVWTTNPFSQIFGYFSDVNAIHNANVFINLVQAGRRFGIPHEAAKNDQTATINPITHYLAFSFVNKIEDCFWKGILIPQCYFTIQTPSELGQDWWKIWKWIHLNTEPVSPVPYNHETALVRFTKTIGTLQISRMDIYIWWTQWVERQTDLSEKKKEELINELQAMPGKDANGKLKPMTFNGELFEVEGQFQPKFLKAMLIEMGILEKPAEICAGIKLIRDEHE